MNNSSTTSGRLAPCAVEEAWRRILAHTPVLPAVRTHLAEALGRVLREEIVATEDFPAFDRSAMDGFALRADDPSEELEVVDEIRAGEWKPRRLQKGEAVSVATGAALPDENLVVVPQENVIRDGRRVRCHTRPAVSYVRRKGEDWRAGTILARRGTRATAEVLAALAQAGQASPLVSPRLRVLHLVTGDELVPPGAACLPGQVRDVNSTLMAGLLAHPALVLRQYRLPEALSAAVEPVRQLLAEGTDLLLISGGASVGRHDETAGLLERLGFTLHIQGVRARPGKPLLFGVAGPCIAFGLPGNPLAHWVSFHLYVNTALSVLEGAAGTPAFQAARMAAPLTGATPALDLLIPGRAWLAGGEVLLEALPWNSSGDITPLLRANALVWLPAGAEPVPAGAPVRFLPTGPVLLNQSEPA